ncbi:hypothetical protein PENTCL1PPCAC_17381, partial [Pristionchus entomophagus]
RDELERHPLKRRICVVGDMAVLSVSPQSINCEFGGEFTLKLANHSAFEVIYKLMGCTHSGMFRVANPVGLLSAG